MSDEQGENLASYGEGDFEIMRGEDIIIPPEDAGPKTKEIYYMLAYDPQEKKWMSADAMIYQLNGGRGQVLEGDGFRGHWRELEDGLEKDMDYDNVEMLTEFIRQANEK